MRAQRDWEIMTFNQLAIEQANELHRVREVNADLLAALKLILGYDAEDPGAYMWGVQELARAAIAKATQS